jgi:chromosome segregation ATPase
MSNEKVQTAFKDIQSYIDSLEKKLAEHKAKLDEVESTTNVLDKEKTEAIEKLKQMEKEMSELSSVYEELKGQKDVEINLQEVMKLYVILTEQVLDGSAHIKLLTLLHGKKKDMTKSDLSMASGIQPAATLRAIFELRNNGLVTYNEENEIVKLVRRLFD